MESSCKNTLDNRKSLSLRDIQQLKWWKTFPERAFDKSATGGIRLERATGGTLSKLKMPQKKIKSASGDDNDDRKMLDLFHVVYETCRRRG